MWRSNDSIYSTFSPLKAWRVKLLRDYTTQLDRLITPSIAPIPHLHQQAGAGKRVLTAYELPKDRDCSMVCWLYILGKLADVSPLKPYKQTTTRRAKVRAVAFLQHFCHRRAKLGGSKLNRHIEVECVGEACMKGFIFRIWWEMNADTSQISLQLHLLQSQIKNNL